MSDGEEEGALLPGLALKRRLAAGELCLCMTVRFSRSVEIATLARAAGYDALYVDLEHSTLTLDQASQICLAAALAGLTPIIRVPSHHRHDMSRALDGGAHGVIVPHVDTLEQAEACVDFCKFPPLGSRSLTGLGPLAGRPVSTGEAFRLINENTLVVAMLESPRSIDNADAIAAVEGVDMLLIGTNDLCAELGISGKLDDPRVREAYEAASAACRRHGKALGVGGLKEGPMLEAAVGMGARFLLGRVDSALLQAAAQRETEQLRRLPAGGQGT